MSGLGAQELDDPRRPGATRSLYLDTVPDAPAQDRRAEGRLRRHRSGTAERRQLDLEAGAGLVLDHDPGADRNHLGVARFDDLRVVEPVSKDGDPPLEQRLLVLRRVVLEVLGELAVAARNANRLDDLLALRPLELGEIGREARMLFWCQVVGHSRDSPISAFGGPLR